MIDALDAGTWWLQEPPPAPLPFAQSGRCLSCHGPLRDTGEQACGECYGCSSGMIEANERDEWN